jgi:hypothetical protein
MLQRLQGRAKDVRNETSENKSQPFVTCRVEQDRLWLRRPGVSGNSASHWQRGQFRIAGGAVFESVLHGKAKPALRICSVENVFDVKPLDSDSFPERCGLGDDSTNC